MLECSHELGMIAERWEAVERRVELPESMRRGFFDRTGPTPVSAQSVRSFHRFYLRSAAIVEWGDRFLGGYTQDVSRQGIGFLSPVQIWPLERVDLHLSCDTRYQLEIARCRRVGPDCYACGGRFVL